MTMTSTTSSLRNRILTIATVVSLTTALALADPAQAFGGHGHGIRLHVQGGSSSDHNGVYGGGFGRGFNGGNRSSQGSGFGYNAGVYGQGAYLPYHSSRCLVRADDGDVTRIVRIC